MKIKGTELQDFMNTGWPQPEDHWFWDHDVFEDTPDPDTVYETSELGPIQYQGTGEDPTRGQGYDVAKAVRAWRKSRVVDTFTVEVPKAEVEVFRAMMKTHGFAVKAGH